jgi:drug/metabolite transporter (DMT)-like permease
MTAVLALAASAFWGASDFMGGAVSRRLAAFDVIFVSQALAVLILGFAAYATGAWTAPPDYVPWAVAAGVVGVLSVGAFYQALATGTMGVVAPIAASGVIVPLVVGIAQGNRVGAVQVAGIVLAVAGVIAVSGPDLQQTSVRPIVLAVLAAAGFGAGVVFIAQASRTNVVMSLLTLRITSVGCLAVAAVALRRRPKVSRADLPSLAVIGIFDLAANAAYASSTTRGTLSLVAVLASLYPAVTVLLARQLHSERLTSVQASGATAAVLGAVLIAAGGTG